jgi:tetratricopeptide (TPR) repeat protein
MKPGRNDPCPCASGKKYKKCCGQDHAEAPPFQDVPQPAAPEADSTPPAVMAQLLSLFNSGRYAELEKLAQTLVGQYPNFGLVWKILGVALKMQGKAALDAMQKATALLPNDPEAHYNLANAMQELGQLEPAVAGYRRALELKFDDAGTHCNLGNVWQELGQFDEAMACFRTALKFEPGNAELHYNLGNALVKLDQPNDAIASFHQALALKPDYAEAYNNLGNALTETGQLDAAQESLRRALQINPGYVEAHNNLGNVLRELRLLDAATGSYRRALAIKPNFAQAHVNLGLALRALGHHAEAEASCQAALETNPDLASALIFKAELHADQGQFAEAENAYRRAIVAEPESPKAWSGISRVRKMTPADATWLADVQRIAEKNIPPRKEVYLRYALGKYFDDVKDFEQAFHNYRRANELTKSYSGRYEEQRQTLAVDLLTSIYDQAWIRRERIDTNTSVRPVFIVGMPRSGTSLAEQILASHPAVFGAGELAFWKNAAVRRASAQQDEMTVSTSDKTAEEYLSLLQSFSPDALRVVDKMPGNFLYLGLIHATFPNARIIHMQRNPIDTCLSIYFQHFNATHVYANDLEDLAHYYTEYFRTMEHWRATLPANSILHVPYEGLVDDQESWSRKMLEFIGLPWDARCIDFHRNERKISTVSNWQVRQKISKSSVDRWLNYEKFVGPLRKLLRLSVDE